jgi:hypothetical protein
VFAWNLPSSKDAVQLPAQPQSGESAIHASCLVQAGDCTRLRGLCKVLSWARDADPCSSSTAPRPHLTLTNTADTFHLDDSTRVNSAHQPYTMDAEGGHPYFPQDVVIPGYAPNSTPLPVILGAFGGILSAFVNVSVAVARWNSPALKKTEQLVIGWFLLCGLPCSSPRASTVRVADNLFRRISPSLLRGYASQPHTLPP